MTHAELAGVPSRDCKKACHDALEAVSLEHRARSRIRELSKGMQQRFGIAQAMVGDPRLLILDEPTSGLDPLAQIEVKEVISRLRKRGITIFFSSHKLTEVENMCDEVAILHKGNLLKRSTLDALVEPGHHVDIRFQGSGVKFTEGLSSLEIKPVGGEGSVMREVQVNPEQIDAAIDQIHRMGGSVNSVMPERLSLEEAFFRLVRDADGSVAIGAKS
jgi:ABC-2 type transport system ATP-binding protein